MTPEAKLLKECRQRISAWLERGIVIHTERINSGKININGRWIQMAQAGTPDLVVYLNHNSICYILWFECKSETGIQTYEQHEFEYKFKNLNNVIYEVIRDSKQIDKTIDRITGYWDKQIEEIKL